jgi:CrcB protein
MGRPSVTAFLVVVGGGLGALARYWLSGVVQRRVGSFPWGTTVVNLSGALLLGVALGLTEGGDIEAAIRDPFTIGVLGGYTTFSTWMVETNALGSGGGGAGLWRAAGNVLLPLIAGVALASLGFALGSAV